jgi:hypothetical protein
MVSATIQKRESEKPSAIRKQFSLLRLLYPEPIDEISKRLVFSASLVGLFFKLTRALRAYRPRAYRTPSNFLGFGVALITEIANDFVAAIDNDYFMIHILISFLGQSFSLRRPKDSRQNPSMVKVESRASRDDSF